MDLKDTVALMTSADYKDRFEAEYEQLNIRYTKLSRMIAGYKAGRLDFTPACPVELLERQLKAMGEYQQCLKLRAEIEGIEV